MKTKLFDKNGKEKGLISLPENFSVRIREDILSRVFEAQKGIHAQSYGAMEGAGAQYSASGISKKKVSDVSMDCFIKEILGGFGYESRLF